MSIRYGLNTFCDICERENGVRLVERNWWHIVAEIIEKVMWKGDGLAELKRFGDIDHIKVPCHGWG
jgi:hypothetical protein